MSPAMEIKTRPAVEADLPTIAALSDAGFSDHQWSRAMYPVRDREGNVARYLARHSNAFQSAKTSFFVATVPAGQDDDGKKKAESAGNPTEGGAELLSSSSSSAGTGERVVGYSRWEVTCHQQPEAEWDVPYDPHAWPVPAGAVAAANDRMARPLHDMRRRHYRGAPMVLLNYLVVDPAFQRRGVGGRLIRWGLDEADRLGLPAWVEATDAGYGLYTAGGFQPVDVINEDLSAYGVAEPCIITIMHRPARQQQQQQPQQPQREGQRPPADSGKTG